MEDSSDSLFVYAGRLRRWTHRTRRPGAPASIPSPQPQNKSENHFIMYRYWKGRGESLGRPKAARDTGRAGSRLRGYLSLLSERYFMLYITRSSLVPGSELFWTDRQTRASEADGPDRRADRTAVASLESRPPCVPWFLAEGSAGSRLCLRSARRSGASFQVRVRHLLLRLYPLHTCLSHVALWPPLPASYGIVRRTCTHTSPRRCIRHTPVVGQR